MLKLQYRSTYTFTGPDIFDLSDPPITYEAWARQSPEWAGLCRDWAVDGGVDVDRALQIVGMGIVSVTQNGERWPLNGREGAEALRAAVEEQNPGMGDRFIIHLALGHYNLHFRKLADLEKNSAVPSTLIVDGKVPA